MRLKKLDVSRFLPVGGPSIRGGEGESVSCAELFVTPPPNPASHSEPRPREMITAIRDVIREPRGLASRKAILKFSLLLALWPTRPREPLLLRGFIDTSVKPLERVERVRVPNLIRRRQDRFGKLLIVHVFNISSFSPFNFTNLDITLISFFIWPVCLFYRLSFVVVYVKYLNIWISSYFYNSIDKT